MTDLLYSLLGGIALIVLVFVAFYRFSKLPGKMVAVVVAFLVSGTYVPISIFIWPGADVFAIHIAIYLVTVYVLGIISSQRDARKREGQSGFGFHWAPAAIVIFFLLVITADSIFIVMAQKGVSKDVANWLLPKPQAGGEISSYFPGTVSHDYHEKEDQYNQYLKRFKEQQERDWRVRKGWLVDPVEGKSALFRVEIKDNHGKPLQSAKVTSKFLRPANSRLDQSFNLQEIEAGVYQGSLVLSEPGKWDLVLVINKDNNLHEIRATTTVASNN